MRKPINFRLSHQSISILLFLEDKTKDSKTAIVEKALQLYLKKQIAQHHPLMKFAGCLNEDVADQILRDVNTSKYNKNIKAKL